MGIRAFNPAITRKITCPFDKTTPQAAFVISEALPVSVRAEIIDAYTEYERKDSGLSFRYKRGLRSLQIVRFGLKSVLGVQGPDGSDIAMEFETTADGKSCLKEESLQHLSIRLPGMAEAGYDTLIDWLADEIWKANSVEDKEAGFFASPSEPKALA